MVDENLASGREAIEQADVRGRLSRYRCHDDEDFRARGAMRRPAGVSCGEQSEFRRVPSGGDGRAHDVSHLNGRGLAGGTTSMRRMSAPQSGHGKAAPIAMVADSSHGPTFGSTG